MLKKIRNYILAAVFVFAAGYVAAYAVQNYNDEVQRQVTTQTP